MFHSSTQYIVWIIVLLPFLPFNRIGAQDTQSTEVNLVSSQKKNTADASFILDKIALSRLLKSRPESIHTWLPNRANQLVAVELIKTKVHRKEIRDMVFYRGRLRQSGHSLVSLSITNNEIQGFISDRSGNFSIDTDEQAAIRVINAKSDGNSSLWTCHTTATSNSHSASKSAESPFKSANSDTLSIYFECDYALYELHGFSRSAIEAYVFTLFNQVQAIYAQENIDIVIEEIKVWEQPDPYDQNSVDAALLDFRDHLGQSYPGTFAHLLSGNPNVEGGLAFINGLCDRDRSYAYSNLDVFIDPNGGYSWDVHVVAHELGHNFGSPHTHDCAWGPSGNEAIDACGAPAPECENAPIPPEGGTIMSYCHTAPVGINFSLGFGPEPGNLIRSMIVQCQEISGDACYNAIPIYENGTYTTTTLDRGSGATHAPATHAQWYTFTPAANGTITIESCEQGVDTRLYLYSGTCSDLTEIQNSDDDCFSGGGFNYASQITNYEVLVGVPLLFEWDDRWSSESFSFSFSFVPDQMMHCENGIQDMDETGIDCGGSCTPCPPLPCQDDQSIPEIIETSLLYSSMEFVQYEGSVRSNAELNIQSGEEIKLEPGFEVLSGASLIANIEECSN